MKLQAVTVFGGVIAVEASILQDGRVGLEMRIEHRLVNAAVITVRAAERFHSGMIP